MDTAQVLRRLLERGFRFRSFEAYPRSLGVERDNFVALLEASPEDGLSWPGACGYLLDGKIAVLVERAGHSVFRAKQEEVPASPEMLEAYRLFQQDLREVLHPAAL